MPFSIGSIEFYNIILQKIADAVFKTQAISFGSFFSFYVIIWSIIAFLIDIFEIKNSKLILAQFIISLILIIPGLLIIVCTLANPDAAKKASESVSKENVQNHNPKDQTERTNIKKEININEINVNINNQK